MLLITFEQIISTPLEGIVTITVFCASVIIALSFHEFSHALIATILGDRTSKREGRLSLNPTSHIEPFGAAMLLLVGFGWAKPVPVNPHHLRMNERSGMAAVAAAGPLSNLLLAAFVSVSLHLNLVKYEIIGFSLFQGRIEDIVSYTVVSLIFWNLLIASFNLIPLVPLDGFKLTIGLLPEKLSNAFRYLERFGLGPLLIIVALGFVVPGGILSRLIYPTLNLLSNMVLGRHMW